MHRRRMCEVFWRDHFHCRYCGARTILSPIMELLSGIYPDIFPFNPGWKGGETHPALLSRSPVVDHVVPGTPGGSWDGLDNLVTACWICNGLKADFTLEQIGWVVQPIVERPWDGLASLYRELWERAGQPKPTFHVGWMRNLGVFAPSIG